MTQKKRKQTRSTTHKGGSVMERGLGSYALGVVRKFFPEVEKVKDSTGYLSLEVTKGDINSRAARKHKECPLATACKRMLKADGVVVSVRTVYVVEGKTATRYQIPESGSREIVSFDRDGGFAPGYYFLKPPDKKLGESQGGHTGNHGRSGKKIQRKHFTSGIRTVLGSGLTD